MMAFSSFFLRDLSAVSLHTEVKASDTNWLSSSEPATPSEFCSRVPQQRLGFVSAFAKCVKLVLRQKREIL